MTIEKMNVLINIWLNKIKPNIEDYIKKIQIENNI